jgi:hypothetical protein
MFARLSLWLTRSNSSRIAVPYPLNFRKYINRVLLNVGHNRSCSDHFPFSQVPVNSVCPGHSVGIFLP